MLAEVKAVVEEVVSGKEKCLSDEVEMVKELSNLPAGSRYGFGGKLSLTDRDNARSYYDPGPCKSRTSIYGDRDSLLKQSTWGSRFSLKGEASEESNVSSFVRRKDLWERRSTGKNDEEDRKSLHSSREEWRLNTNPGYQNTSILAPDLVMNLPTGPLKSSPPIPAPRPIHLLRRSQLPSSDSFTSNLSRSSESPAISIATADNIPAKTDTLYKSEAAPHSLPLPLLVFHQIPDSQIVSFQSQGPQTPNPSISFTDGHVSTLQTTFSGQSSSFKPAVKVKPIVPVKQSEVKKDLVPIAKR